MKIVTASILTIVASVSAYASIPNSLGKNLACKGSASLSTPYFTC